MDAKEAAMTGKKYILEMLSDEGPENIGLEEIEYVPQDNVWLVTIGFSRPWNSTRGSITALTGQPSVKRAYRVLRIDNDDNRVLTMKRREFTAQNVSDFD